MKKQHHPSKHQQKQHHQEDDDDDAPTSSPLEIPNEQVEDENDEDDHKLPASAAASVSSTVSHITHLPTDLQVNILTYLRAYELVYSVHPLCKFYHNPQLIHSIVSYASEHVYPSELTNGFEDQPVTTIATSEENTSPVVPVKKGGGKKNVGKKAAAATTCTEIAVKKPILFTLEHLRNMELLVVARVLSRPEPPCTDDELNTANGAGAGGYYVSKSWCKTALKWLECQQERRQELLLAQQQQQSGNNGHKKKQQKKLSKKQQRLRQRKYSDVSVPWPNVNADILCEHQQLQRCSNRKSARARRRLLDQPGWRCLQKLYPDSTTLTSIEGECWQCTQQQELVRQQEVAQKELAKIQRKAPLCQTEIRRFYTRSRGVPSQCLVVQQQTSTTTSYDNNDSSFSSMSSSLQDLDICVPIQDNVTKNEETNQVVAATTPSRMNHNNQNDGDDDGCPLLPGLYVVLPRAWCHSWRRYMKTGEGGPILPPDASALLCDAHRLILLPPHLEDYLYGETIHLLSTTKKKQKETTQVEQTIASIEDEIGLFSPRISSVASRATVVGLSPSSLVALPEDDTVAVAALGLTAAEVEQQQRALLSLERQRQQELQQQQRDQQEAADDIFMNDDGDRRRSSLDRELLDRENYCCVEILTEDEFAALEKLWPKQQGLFGLRFQVDDGGRVAFSTPPCRECDASGLANGCKIPKHAKATLRAAHQARVRKYAENKAAHASNGSGRPGLQVEY